MRSVILCCLWPDTRTALSEPLLSELVSSFQFTEVNLEMPPPHSSSLCGWGNRGTQQVKNYFRITRGTGGWQNREVMERTGPVWVCAQF